MVRNSLMYLLALQLQAHPISWLTFSNTCTSEDKTAQERWCCIVPGRHWKDQLKQKAETFCFDINTSKLKSYCTVGQAVPATEDVFFCPRDFFFCKIFGQVLLFLPTDIYLVHTPYRCAAQANPFVPLSVTCFHSPSYTSADKR